MSGINSGGPRSTNGKFQMKGNSRKEAAEDPGTAAQVPEGHARHVPGTAPGRPQGRGVDDPGAPGGRRKPQKIRGAGCGAKSHIKDVEIKKETEQLPLRPHWQLKIGNGVFKILNKNDLHSGISNPRFTASADGASGLRCVHPGLPGVLCPPSYSFPECGHAVTHLLIHGPHERFSLLRNISGCQLLPVTPPGSTSSA